MISFFSLHFQKAWLNPCNIRYKNTEGLMGKQNRLLTWNPLLIKANKRHILDSSRLCGWWQIVMLTMVIMSPATYIFHSWQFSQTTHAFIFHYETPLCNKLAITEITRGAIPSSWCAKCICAHKMQETSSNVPCQERFICTVQYLAWGRLKESRIKLATPASDLLITVQQLRQLSHNSPLPLASGLAVPRLFFSAIRTHCGTCEVYFSL